LLAKPIGPRVIVHFRLDARSVVGPAVLEAPARLHFFDPTTELAI
jgi:hypothetical protein